MGGVCAIGSVKGRLSPVAALSGTLSVPIGGALDCDIYEGEYTVTPGSEPIILATANKLLKNDIVIEASPNGIPEGSEMATDDDIDSLISDVFGEENVPKPSYDLDDIATEEELNTVISGVFG